MWLGPDPVFREIDKEDNDLASRSKFFERKANRGTASSTTWRKALLLLLRLIFDEAYGALKSPERLRIKALLRIRRKRHVDAIT